MESKTFFSWLKCFAGFFGDDGNTWVAETGRWTLVAYVQGKKRHVKFVLCVFSFVSFVFLVGGFKYFYFHPHLGKISKFDYVIFFKWVGSTTN